MNFVKILLFIHFTTLQLMAEESFFEVKKMAQILKPKLDQAISVSASLFPNSNNPINKISIEDCEKIRSEVEKNYPISPFKAKYSGGTNYSVFCGTEASRFSIGPIYFDEIKIKSNFSREAKWQLAFFQKNKNGFGFGGYLINKKYELIEAFYFQLANENDLNSKTHFSIWSLDENNNYFAQSSGLPRSKNAENIQHYISGDLNYQVFKVNRLVKVDDKYEFLTTEDYKWAESLDWDSAYLIPTHAWTNPFFKYEAQLIREMKNSNRWVINIFDKQTCEDILLTRNFEVLKNSECTNHD